MDGDRMDVDDVELTHDEDDMAVELNAATASQSGASSIRTRAKARRVLTHRCRFPDWTPGAIHALAITPASFDTSLLGYGGVSGERGMIAVGRSNGDVELMLWGGHQGWATYRTLPCSFPMPQTRNSKKPSTLLSHLVFTHQTTLSPPDTELYDGDVEGAQRELRRLQREGLRLFGVGGVGSELVEWEWGGPGASKEVGRIKSTLPTLPPIFALAASRSSAHLAIGCEDSTIRILNILDNELDLVAKIEIGGPGKVRPLSLAWGPLRPAADAAWNSSDKGKERGESPSAPSALPQHFATPRESYVVTGCSNSSIRRFDAPSSGAVSGVWRSVHRMTLDQLRGEHTVVWAASVLQDGTIVSGDSMGNVKFWDAEMGTQTQSFKTHKADVLALAIGADGTSIFTSGVDQKTVEFRLVTISSNRSNDTTSRRWVQASGRRLHSHDVRAMVVSPPYTLALPSPPPSTSPRTAQVPILTSGGLDLSLITVCVSSVPARAIKSARSLTNPISDHRSIEYETTVHRRAAYVPQRSKPFAVAGQGGARWLICQRDRGVAIWRLDDPKLQRGSTQGRSGWKARQDRLDGVQEEMEDDEGNTPGWAKAAELELKLHTNLIASAISPDGRWLAISDLYETKLFRLEVRNGDLLPRRQKMFSSALSDALPTSLGTGSAQLAFTTNSQRLVLASSFGSSIAVVELSMDREKSFYVSKVFGQHNEHRGDREIRAVPNGVNGVNGAAHSESGSDSDSDDDDEERSSRASTSDRPATVVCLAISPDGKWLASADLERKVCVFDLENLKHHTTLPTPTHVPSALAFIPSSSSLVIALPTNSMSVFDLSSLKFHRWALPLSKLSANTLTDMREPILGLTFEPRSEATNLSSSMSNKVHPSRRVTTHQNEQLGLAWGANWVGTIDFDALSKGTNAPGKTAPQRRAVDKKRAREEDLASGAVGDDDDEPKLDIRTTRKYQPLVLFDFVTNGELIVVERTWQDLSQGLVQAWAKSGEFGT
ncbi:BQ2448_8046 [Microbotryum intermedium]|uniref:BQ2448_8046 protein n=1 Tax=Microbotryum intermedium TaxID=269621 RepID=A0A238FP02_9BASI|nr:BQ2448_8046 [Microbotryum intermedium]